MQDRYVGDVGDFAKYALLRAIARHTNLRLAVVWYLYSDENHNADGRHVSYLRDAAFAKLDPELHAAMAELVDKSCRSVRAVAAAKILPPDTTYFTGLVSDRADATKVLRAERVRSRAMWLKKALKAAHGHDMVFLDPDNGIETASVQHHTLKSGKYAYWNELEAFWAQGNSLVVYHHLNRTMTVARQADMLREKFESRFPDAPFIGHFLARRGSCRHFWIVGQKCHSAKLQRSAEKISQTTLRACLEFG